VILWFSISVAGWTPDGRFGGGMDSAFGFPSAPVFRSVLFLCQVILRDLVRSVARLVAIGQTVWRVAFSHQFPVNWSRRVEYWRFFGKVDFKACFPVARRFGVAWKPIWPVVFIRFRVF